MKTKACHDETKIRTRMAQSKENKTHVENRDERRIFRTMLIISFSPDILEVTQCTMPSIQIECCSTV